MRSPAPGAAGARRVPDVAVNPIGWPALAVLAALLGAPGAAAQEAEATVAVLQGLNKVTARVSAIDAPVGQAVRFGTLEITAHTCHKAPPEEPPESVAFLEIRDLKPDEPPVELFVGWMFASSPALSALEHPVYDIWVLDCREGGGGEGISKVPLVPLPPEPPPSSE